MFERLNSWKVRVVKCKSMKYYCIMASFHDTNEEILKHNSAITFGYVVLMEFYGALISVT